MRYLSVCSGIEAATVAWHVLGWTPVAFAEIEKFPSAVLAHHYPAVPNVGDMRGLAVRILRGEIEAPDVLVGGTPCQAFSVAGERESLNDERGNLTLRFVELAAAIDAARLRAGKPPCIVVWENVPGVLSTDDNAYGCFLAGLAGEDEPLQPAGKKWSNAGAVLGPRRAIAWRTLDAQYFGLAQRRRRVFAVASARNGFDPCAVLFEWQGVRRDSAPRRGAPEDTAGTLAGGARRRGGFSYDDIPSVAHCLNAGGMGRQDSESESETMIVAAPLRAQPNASLRADNDTYIADTLRGHPRPGSNSIGATVVHGTQDPCVGDAAFALGRNSGQENAIAFSCKDHGADAGDVAPTLRAMGHAGSHANAGGQLAVAFAANSRGELRLEAGDGSRTGTLSTGGGKPGQGTPMVSGQSGVRRLTPRECERLQGFPDDYTLIPYGHVRQSKLDEDWLKYLMRGGKLSREQAQAAAADGPRYKALGNSMAVPCMRWIGVRIDEALA